MGLALEFCPVAREAGRLAPQGRRPAPRGAAAASRRPSLGSLSTRRLFYPRWGAAPAAGMRTAAAARLAGFFARVVAPRHEVQAKRSWE